MVGIISFFQCRTQGQNHLRIRQNSLCISMNFELPAGHKVLDEVYEHMF